MRLSEEKIKQGILHPEPSVRDMAVSYFAMAFSRDRTVMPMATQAIDRFDFQHAFSDLELLQNFAQSDGTVTWLVGVIAGLGTSCDQHQWEYVESLSWILAEAEAGLLKRRRKEILALHLLDASARKTIEQRTRLLSASPDTCWSEFIECCHQLGATGQASADVLARAYLMLEAIAYHPKNFADRILSTLSAETSPQADLTTRWTNVCAIRAAGQMQLTATVPHLIRILAELHEEWVYEECVIALTRIGGDGVVKAVWNASALAPDHFHDYAAWVLEGIHSDLSEQAALHLFQAARDPATKIAFAHALLSDFAIDGIVAVRNLIHHETDTEEIRDLRNAWMAVCLLAEADFPELQAWQAQMQEEQKYREQWQTPEFPVVDTWSSQLANPQPPPRSAKFAQGPIRIPQVRKFRNVGRNEPCPCNSGKKFKSCCMHQDDSLLFDAHWNDRGQAFAAGHVSEFLLQAGLLPDAARTSHASIPLEAERDRH